MNWKREPNAINGRPSYQAIGEFAYYRVSPACGGGFQLAYLLTEDSRWSIVGRKFATFAAAKLEASRNEPSSPELARRAK